MPEIDAGFVNRETSKWWQGDFVLVDDLPEELRFEMLHLMSGAELNPPTEDQIAWEPASVAGFALVSQTCDTAKPWNGKSERRWVVLAPVIELKEKQWDMVIKGKLPRHHTFASLQPKSLVIDLERMLTVSKLVLARMTVSRQAGCQSREERWDLAVALGDKLSRPALPDDLTSSEPGHEGAIAGLEQFLADGALAKTDMGQFLAVVDEIRLLPISADSANPWDTPKVEILFYFIVRASKSGIPDADLERWEACAKEVVSKMVQAGRFSLRGEGYKVETWDSLSAAEYLSSDRLPY